jgi:hypothetical protein
VTGTRDQKQLKCDENDERILWPARGLYAKETNTETTKREIVKGGEENVWRGDIRVFIYSPLIQTNATYHIHIHPDNHVIKFYQRK